MTKVDNTPRQAAPAPAPAPATAVAPDVGGRMGVLPDICVGVVVSGPTGASLRWNPAACSLLALDDAQMSGEAPDPARTFVHEDGSDFQAQTQPLAVALATGRPVRGVVMGICHLGRQQRQWLLVNAEPRLDTTGVVAEVIATYTDISERRGFEARRALADRLTALGTLAAGIAHEINNPLAYIMANLAYADDELSDPLALASPARLSEVRHAIIEARDGANRVRNIVTEMRTLARGDGAPRPINVALLMESAARSIASELRTRATLRKELGEVPLVEADEARLGQVFINLLLNAADAIPEGRPTHNEVAVVTFVDAAGSVVVEVRDTGAGIPAELHERVFDPFFTNKPVGKGMGLSLAICHHVVTELGGAISVHAAPQRGTVFRITLPPAKAS